MILWLDLETRCGHDLRTVGAYRYAEDAEILLFSYAFDDEPAAVVDFAHGEPMPARLLAAFDDPTCVFIAHNSMFDRNVLKRIWPQLGDPARWRDSMIKAFSLSLPGSLGELCSYLGLPTDKAKDAAGKRLIKLYCGSAASKGRSLFGAEDPDWVHFVEYARLDVEAMREVWRRMPSWNDEPRFWDEWHVDQAINDRGVRLDLELAQCAVAAAGDVKAEADAAVRKHTQGVVQSATQRDALLDFLRGIGVKADDLRKGTLEALLADDSLPDAARELITSRLYAGKASIAKYEAMLRYTNSDGRVRGCMLYCGASRTGRWSSKNLQLQNFPRGSMKPDEVLTAIDALKTGVAPLLYDDVNEVASSCLRGALTVDGGHKLVVADLSNIEGRVLAWLAGERWKLDAFRAYDAGTGVDLYKATYARTFGIDPADVTKTQRQVGKVLELAMGYMGGVGSFLAFAGTYHVDLHDLAQRTHEALDAAIIEESKSQYEFFAKKGLTQGLEEYEFVALNAIKAAWRKAHPAITRFWAQTQERVKAAMGLEAAVDGEPYPVAFAMTPFGLACKLPSGRIMAYPRAAVPTRADGRCLFTYYGQYQQRHAWGTLRTHQGKVVENITQATARDVLAGNMSRVEAAGFRIVSSVHDELLTETPDEPQYTAEKLAALMTTPPAWGRDMPLSAAGFEAYRYKKD